ncbi:hypothetical protein KNO15_11785 [Leifsonia shinshuensis]|uniref:hypothetical protein n=1 Tax=Leifsonia shinshuensis TaxID=150026 RepID=UPI001F5111C0|nr:hypothetical protein [Leifsonia shinshuensis]MCI0157373.1 hypothetical protein [Leifsonia shinshuensis]
MRRLAGELRSAIADGRFITAWSLLASVPLSVMLMAPIAPGGDLVRALGATSATWACFAAWLMLVAVGERGGRSRSARSAIVIAGVVASAALRPVLQDSWAHTFGLTTLPGWQLPLRSATNVVVWGAALGAIAIVQHMLGSLRATNARLRVVAKAIEGSRGRARSYEADATRAVRAAASELRNAVDALPSSVGADELKALASRFQARSRRLQEESADRADSVAAAERADASAPGHPYRHRHPHRMPFRLPPVGVVTGLYIVCLLPYALRSAGPAALLGGLAAVALGGLLLDSVPRRRTAIEHGSSSTLFVRLALVIGVGLSLLAAAQGTTPPLAALSAVAYAGCAVGAGLCAGALHALRREQRRLSGAITTAQRTTRESTRDTRAGLRRTAELLHRDGQGACLLASLTSPAPTAGDIADLRVRLRAVIQRMPSTFASDSELPAPDAETALIGLADLWGHVIDLRLDLTDAARTALRTSPWTADEVYDVAAEGLLNAVKHSAERRAEIVVDIATTGAGPRLRVRVTSFGPAVGAQLRPGSHVRSLGARLLAQHDGAVLEAVFPIRQEAAVVSPEHPG